MIWHVDLLLPVVEATTQLKVHKEMFGVGKRLILLCSLERKIQLN